MLDFVKRLSPMIRCYIIQLPCKEQSFLAFPSRLQDLFVNHFGPFFFKISTYRVDVSSIESETNQGIKAELVK